MFAGCEPKPIPDNPPESSKEEVKTAVVVAPTATEDGYTEYRCSVCGETVKGDIVPKGE